MTRGEITSASSIVLWVAMSGEALLVNMVMGMVMAEVLLAAAGRILKSPLVVMALELQVVPAMGEAVGMVGIFHSTE